MLILSLLSLSITAEPLPYTLDLNSDTITDLPPVAPSAATVGRLYSAGALVLPFLALLQHLLPDAEHASYTNTTSTQQSITMNHRKGFHFFLKEDRALNFS